MVSRTLADTDWKPYAAELAANLAASGVLHDPAWIQAFTKTPRHLFTPRVIHTSTTIEAGTVISEEDGQRWLETVYADEALLTQIAPTGQGAETQQLPTSSSSQPTVMAVMLERADIRTGMRVLEIGTGTGYHSALLCHRLGSDNVYSVDIDAGLVGQARERLASLDYHPTLIAGDGASGLDKHGPFDRIIATCAVTHIPSAWIAQLAEGGRIVAPLDADRAGPLMVLNKTADDEVAGRFDTHPTAWFMPLRNDEASPLAPGQSMTFTDTRMPHYGTTSLNPALLAEPHADLVLFLQLHLPGLRLAGGQQIGSLFVHTSDALAEVPMTALPDGEWPVTQRGNRRLWDTLEHAVANFEKLGRPGRTRYGITATTDIERQYVWLDDPASAHSWPLVAS